MKTSMGPWDALFGERITLDLPLPDGTTKRVVVTKKWWEEMVKQGKIKDVTPSIVKVNILGSGLRVPAGSTNPVEIVNALEAEDPLVQIEHWQVGVQVSNEQYAEFLDHASKELYAIRKHDVGQIRTLLVQRSLWEQTRQVMENL
jgi:hypothetical protein